MNSSEGQDVENKKCEGAEQCAILKDALEESEAHKDAIVEGLSDILILFGSDLKALWANGIAAKKYPQYLGKTCHEIFCAKTTGCSSCAFSKSLKSTQFELSTQKTGMVGDDGDETVFDITCSPVKKKGTIFGFVVIARNVTEHYRLEKQLRHTQKMEAIGTLAGGVAHDFNNVLTPIMGYSEIIRLKMRQDETVDPTIYSYLEEILKAAKRAKSLVEQVLTFSRSSEKKERLQYLHPIVKEVMKLMKVTLPSTISIKEDINDQCGQVYIDPVQIHQVLINLCTNSSHAMSGEHGVLTVRLDNADIVDDEAKWIELTITDTGRGIEEKMLDRIFEPYFTTKEKTSGTGMGLAMVHGIISRQGGRIEADSEVGKGSVFRIFLPVVDRETPLEQVLSLGDLQEGRGRILLVDDEEQVVQVTGEILKSLGYTVVGKTSPTEAVELFSQDPEAYDMLITDLTMPELTGLELGEKLKAISPDLPIILFTGYSDQVSKDAAIEAGIDEYCMKPISMRGLSEIVGKFLKPGG